MRVQRSVRLISPGINHSVVKRQREVYEWTITNFEKVSGQPECHLVSPIFSANQDDKDKWYLELYPSGRDKECKDYFSLYLFLTSTKRSEVRLRYEVSIRNPRTNEEIVKRERIMTFVNGMSSGWRHFVTKATILSREDDYLRNDELRIYCEFDYEINPKNETTVSPAFSSSRFIKNLWGFAKRSEYCDVTLVVGDKTFLVHRNVLAARSKIFAIMFKKNSDEHQKNDGMHRVNIENIEPHVMRRLLEFIYTGNVKDIENIAGGLLEAAYTYQLNDLKAHCANILSENLNVRNAADTLVIAGKFNAKELKEQVIKFINNHLVGVVESDGYKMMERDHSELLGDLLRAQAVEMKTKVLTVKAEAV